MTKIRIEIPESDELHRSLSHEIFGIRIENNGIAGRDGVFHWLVERFDGLSIYIWSNEHPPPHFHVSIGRMEASFSIVDCKRLKKNKSLGKNEASVRKWWKKNKILLVEVWNSSRPTNCPVGPIDLDLFS